MRLVSSKDAKDGKYKMKYSRDLIVFSKREGKYIRAKILILCPRSKERFYITRILYHQIDDSEEIGNVTLYFYDHDCISNNPIVEISSYERCLSLRKNLEKFCEYGMERYLSEFFRDLSKVSKSPLEEILRRVYYESSYR